MAPSLHVGLSQTTTISTSVQGAKRLAITKQHLGGKLGRASTRTIMSVVHDIGCIQLDPVNVVAPSHIIVLWSRVGNFRMADLEKLLWDEKRLFEYWAHQSSIVTTEDYPLYYSMMRRYPESFPKPWGAQWKDKVGRWLTGHTELRRTVLRELQKGPLLLGQFEDHARTRRGGSGWSSGSDVSTMLFHLQMSGEVMVVGHQGNQKLWGLTEDFLPSWAEKTELTEEEIEHEAVQRAIRALGIASSSEIAYHFLRGRYRNLQRTLARLQEESVIHRVLVAGLDEDVRYIHDLDTRLLQSLDSDEWEPRVSLLSPFDNLICDRGRTKRLFAFDYVSEIYVPQNKRKFGYYVLPILLGDRFVGRIDPRMDRRNEKLLINSVHAERLAPDEKVDPSMIGKKIEQLADFLGAKEVVYTGRVPSAWRSFLR